MGPEWHYRFKLSLAELMYATQRCQATDSAANDYKKREAGRSCGRLHARHPTQTIYRTSRAEVLKPLRLNVLVPFPIICKYI